MQPVLFAPNMMLRRKRCGSTDFFDGFDTKPCGIRADGFSNCCGDNCDKFAARFSGKLLCIAVGCNFSASIRDEETEPEVSARRPVTNPHITPISLTMAMRTTSPTNTTASPTSGTIKVFMQNTGPFQILGGLRRMR